jgi:hypothetical protein
MEYDVCIDVAPLARGLLRETSVIKLPFSYRGTGGPFEFRLMTSGTEPVPDFNFFGGRLLKQGGSSVLHQSEYLNLLVELVAMRQAAHGLVVDTRQQ